MVKRKSRAARRDQRKRAQKAEERGLPAVVEGAPPPKARKVRGDVAAAALASDKRPRGQRASMLAKPAASGLPVFAKVLMGAAAALVVVYVLSQFRKSDSARVIKDRDVSSERAAEAAESSDSAETSSEQGEGDSREAAFDSEESAVVQQQLEAGELVAPELAADSELARPKVMKEREVAPPLELAPPTSAPQPEVAPPQQFGSESAVPSEGQEP